MVRYTVQAVVVKRYSKGRYGRHKSKWFAYAVAGLSAGILPAQVFELVSATLRDRVQLPTNEPGACSDFNS